MKWLGIWVAWTFGVVVVVVQALYALGAVDLRRAETGLIIAASVLALNLMSRRRPA
jgi:hypothetical protein